MANKRTDVYKSTEDDWYPCFALDYTEDRLVRVSFIALCGGDWRVCIWGADDCGMERDFGQSEETLAWVTFLEVICWKHVNRDLLLALKFVSA